MTMDNGDWIVTEAEFDPTCLHHHETVFTLGNGYLGTRGAFEEGYPRARPATFVHGVYDDVPIVYTELANCPDWLPLAILVEGEEPRPQAGASSKEKVLGDGSPSRTAQQFLAKPEIAYSSPATRPGHPGFFP